MGRALLLLLVGLVVGLGTPRMVLAQTPPALLVPAPNLNANTYLVLTVPLADPQALAATAAAIETRFAIKLAAEWPLRSLKVHCFVMDARGHADIDALIARMRADAQIRTVQRMEHFRTFASPYSDPLLPIQHDLARIDAVAAQRASTGAGVRVGVVDTSIDASHPDLAGRVVERHDFVDDGQHHPAEAHGTAMAGIIAADADNAIGMVGVAPKADLVGLRACWQKPGQAGECNSFSLARAVNYAILNRVKVLNLSLGGPPDPLLNELVRAAVERGLIVVAAWGEGRTPAFPASVPGVIAAGPSTDGAIPAPSVDVLSTAPHDHYRYFSGSSISAALVSGVVALLVSARPDLDVGAIDHALQVAAATKAKAPVVNACQALRSVIRTPLDCTP